MTESRPIIVIVDDEDSVRKSLMRNLEPLNLEIVSFASGVEALSWLRDHEAWVIIADYAMPGLDGTEFLRQAKALRPKARRLMLSGEGDLDVAMTAMEGDVIERYVTKPWHPDKLRKTISCLAKICGCEKCSHDEERPL